MPKRYPTLAHGSTKQSAISLHSSSGTVYQDDPLSDYEDNRRSRPNTIRSYIKPSKDRNAYGNGRSKPHTTDIIPLSCLPKNKSLYEEPQNPIQKRVDSMIQAGRKQQKLTQDARVIGRTLASNSGMTNPNDKSVRRSSFTIPKKTTSRKVLVKNKKACSEKNKSVTARTGSQKPTGTSNASTSTSHSSWMTIRSN